MAGILSGDGGILSIQDIAPQGGGLNFGSLFDGGNPIGIGSLPSLGLQGLEQLAGVDIPGFNDNIGSTIGSIGGLLVGGPLGAIAGNFIGGFGGSMFGGGGHHKVPLPDFTVPENLEGILDDLPNQLRSYRGSGEIFNSQIRQLHEIFYTAEGRLASLGGITEEEHIELNRQYDTINSLAASPGDRVNRNQQMANLASFVTTALAAEEDRVERQNAFLADNPQVQDIIDRERARRPGSRRPVVTREFFDALWGADKEQLQAFDDKVVAHEANPPEWPVDEDPPDELFASWLGTPSTGGGTGSDNFDEQAQAFWEQQQRETDLITAQQQDRALQQDENASDEDRRSSALALLGLTSSFLIKSLNAPRLDPRVNTQDSVSLEGGGSVLSGGSSSLQRDTNVFKSPGFKFQKQDKSKRTDIPLDIIEENPSSFSRLAQIGQGGLVPNPQQDRGLLV